MFLLVRQAALTLITFGQSCASTWPTRRSDPHCYRTELYLYLTAIQPWPPLLLGRAVPLLSLHAALTPITVEQSCPSAWLTSMSDPHYYCTELHFYLVAMHPWPPLLLDWAVLLDRQVILTPLLLYRAPLLLGRHAALPTIAVVQSCISTWPPCSPDPHYCWTELCLYLTDKQVWPMSSGVWRLVWIIAVLRLKTEQAILLCQGIVSIFVPVSLVLYESMGVCTVILDILLAC